MPTVQDKDCAGSDKPRFSIARQYPHSYRFRSSRAVQGLRG